MASVQVRLEEPLDQLQRRAGRGIASRLRTGVEVSIHAKPQRASVHTMDIGRAPSAKNVTFFWALLDHFCALGVQVATELQVKSCGPTVKVLLKCFKDV